MSELELNRAKQAVDMSTREIDDAMHHLEEKLDGTMRSLKRALDRVKGVFADSKEKVMQGRDTVTHAMHQIQSDGREIYSKAKATSQRVAERVKADPTPAYLGVGTVALFVLSAFMLRRRHKPSTDFVQVRPDYLEERSTLFDEVA